MPFRFSILIIGGGGLQPKKTEKNRKKTKKPVPNLKFAEAFGFLGVLWYFFGFFSV